MPNTFVPSGQTSALIEKDDRVQHYSWNLHTFCSLQKLQEFHSEQAKQGDVCLSYSSIVLFSQHDERVHPMYTTLQGVICFHKIA